MDRWIVLSLTAKGLATGEVAARFADVYGATVSQDTISRITDKVIAETAEWRNRPPEPGRFPVIVANPERKGFHCRGMRRISRPL
jgi:transposase-like protein